MIILNSSVPPSRKNTSIFKVVSELLASEIWRSQTRDGKKPSDMAREYGHEALLARIFAENGIAM
jgi:hypothetical protein